MILYAIGHVDYINFADVFVLHKDKQNTYSWSSLCIPYCNRSCATGQHYADFILI